MTTSWGAKMGNERIPPGQKGSLEPSLWGVCEKKKHILFVDDEPGIVRLAVRILERNGYRVTGCTNGLNALELFESEPHSFDLVITDLTMPKMSGVQLAKQISRQTEELPIILCSGHSEPISEETARANGITLTVHKPVVGQELADQVESLLGIL